MLGRLFIVAAASAGLTACVASDYNRRLMSDVHPYPGGFEMRAKTAVDLDEADRLAWVADYAKEWPCLNGYTIEKHWMVPDHRALLGEVYKAYYDVKCN